ncbi:aminoglycoside phosphotransferase family protein [Bosea sp. (in: a-proteobacteria)]|uniref:phosphotransferase family protein n=1 Tax=Bosea sp. (in: a-proteobacteria) TaxID=1871050 RepID=UPI0012106239|nr:aminoglycoside phosphotransferase family protein [Bosea sp. (in: a-proteobacteria)]TAJ28241.1 MAG: phosphotransferase [Bosea sp. (in: a-proteobacteria)]
MTLGLPQFADLDAFDAWRAEPAGWLAAALDIAREADLPTGQVTIFRTGTNLVLGLGPSLILKIFPPQLRGQFLAERATLRQLAGRLPLPIPELLGEGERDGWPWLAMSRLGGALGSDLWPGLPETDKERILHEIGATIAAVQAVPPGPIAALGPRWPDLVAGQVAHCRDRQIRRGLPERYLPDLDALLAAVPATIPLDVAPVILTGEYIPENFLLEERADGWHLSGLFDFGDVFAGLGEYDLLGPSAFMVQGKPGRLAALLAGYGYGPGRLDDALRQRLLTLVFLHRASDPMRQIAIPDWPARAGTLQELGRLLWPG